MAAGLRRRQPGSREAWTLLSVSPAPRPLDHSGFRGHRGADLGALRGPYGADGLPELTAGYPEFTLRVRVPLPGSPSLRPAELTLRPHHTDDPRSRFLVILTFASRFSSALTSPLLSQARPGGFESQLHH